MIRHRRLSLATALSLSLSTLCTLAENARAQDGTSYPYIAAVTGNNVHVRSGPAEAYYPFATLNSGQVVRVIGEKFNWARVTTAGPSFQNSFGYIKVDKDDTGLIRLTANGKQATTLGQTDIVAPNLEANNEPKSSWKLIARLDADQLLNVLGTSETERETIYKVRLPGQSEGWISLAFLRCATDKEIDSFKTAVADIKSFTTAPAPIERKPTQVAKVSSASRNEAAQNKNAEPTTESVASALPLDALPEEPTQTAIAQLEPVEITEPTEPTLEDLEEAFRLLQLEPIESAELKPLRELYLDLARRESDVPRVMRYAKVRAEQLKLWTELQQKRLELESVRAQIETSAEETEAAWQKLELSAEYVVVGRLIASTIYDGVSLPKLLRVQDPGSGRTLAYLRPDEGLKLVSRIGNIVGIVGDKSYDEILRLNIVSPRRIDTLMPKSSEDAPAAKKITRSSTVTAEK